MADERGSAARRLQNACRGVSFSGPAAVAIGMSENLTGGGSIINKWVITIKEKRRYSEHLRGFRWAGEKNVVPYAATNLWRSSARAALSTPSAPAR